MGGSRINWPAPSYRFTFTAGLPVMARSYPAGRAVSPRLDRVPCAADRAASSSSASAASVFPCAGSSLGFLAAASGDRRRVGGRQDHGPGCGGTVFGLVCRRCRVGGGQNLSIAARIDVHHRWHHRLCRGCCNVGCACEITVDEGQRIARSRCGAGNVACGCKGCVVIRSRSGVLGRDRRCAHDLSLLRLCAARVCSDGGYLGDLCSSWRRCKLWQRPGLVPRTRARCFLPRPPRERPQTGPQPFWRSQPPQPCWTGTRRGRGPGWSDRPFDPMLHLRAAWSAQPCARACSQAPWPRGTRRVWVGIALATLSGV